jgi:hypothetical protein
MAGGGDPRDRSAAGVRGQMNLASQPATGAAQRLPAGPPIGCRRFDPAPCFDLGGREDLRGDVGGRLASGARRMLVRADHRGVDRDRPVPTLAQVGVEAQLVENLDPGAIAGPAAMPVVDGLPVPILGWQVPPRQPAPGPPEHSIEHRTVIGPPPTLLQGLVGQQRLQPSPLRVGQIMAIEHGLDLPHPAVMIHGTRSSPGRSAARAPGPPHG